MFIIEKINNYLEKLKQKPEEVRVRYVWGFTIVSFSLIFVVWFFSLGSYFEISYTDEENTLEGDVKGVDSDNIFETMGDDFSDMKEDFLDPLTDIDEQEKDYFDDSASSNNDYSEEARKSTDEVEDTVNEKEMTDESRKEMFEKRNDILNEVDVDNEDLSEDFNINIKNEL